MQDKTVAAAVVLFLERQPLPAASRRARWPTKLRERWELDKTEKKQQPLDHLAMGKRARLVAVEVLLQSWTLRGLCYFGWVFFSARVGVLLVRNCFSFK